MLVGVEKVTSVVEAAARGGVLVAKAVGSSPITGGATSIKRGTEAITKIATITEAKWLFLDKSKIGNVEREYCRPVNGFQFMAI